jgi:hypothetical protein
MIIFGKTYRKACYNHTYYWTLHRLFKIGLCSQSQD